MPAVRETRVPRKREIVGSSLLRQGKTVQESVQHNLIQI